jgi:serine/threonine-protein kinase
MDPQPSLASRLASRYTIDREIGRGGMATVYLARDVRHGRPVALKVLNPELGAVLGVERFLSEIRVTANLQHPNLLPLFDSGEVDGLLYYVMPYVEGESLRHRIDREKQLPIDEAVRIAVAVAGALDYAHRHGVIHRDLKPENILLHDGQPVVADFGIALAVSNAGGARVTQTGLSLGTPQYMSPEQATGDRNVDGRTDIYSLGAVTYEMLAGEPPHSGTTAQAIIAKLMTEEPRPLSAARRSVPLNVEAAVSRALEKLPADRFASAKEFADALTTSTVPTVAARAVGRRTDLRWKRLTLGLALSVVALLGSEVVRWMRVAPPSVERYEIDTPNGEPTFGSLSATPEFAISPDGSRIVYTGHSPTGAGQLWVRDLADLTARPIPGTDAATAPSFSPNGVSIVFAANGALKTVGVRGENEHTIVPVKAFAPAWGDNGRIYFLNSPQVAIAGNVVSSVSETGGPIDTVATFANRSALYVTPLPRGRGLLAVFRNTGEARAAVSGREIAAVAVPSGEVKVLVSGLQAAYSNGRLVYVNGDGAVIAVPFDVRRLALAGPETPLGDTAAVTSGPGLRVTASGSLLYPVGALGDFEMVWVARDGTAQVADTTHGGITFPALSPDGSRIVFAMDRGLWIHDVARGTDTKLLSLIANYASWTADGRSVSYYTTDSGAIRLWRKRADGSDQPTPLLPGRPVVETVWSPDGKWLVYRTFARRGMFAVPAAAAAGSGAAATPLVQSKVNAAQPALSLDGKYLAYVTDETGRFEVYVVPFPKASAAKWIVSTQGGTDPMWAHSGKELFYRDLSGNMTSVTVSTTPSFSLGASKVLFPASQYRSYAGHQEYGVSNDDKRFLMLRPMGGKPVSRLILVRNWLSEMKRRSGGR